MLNHEKESNMLLCLIQAALHPSAEQAIDLISGCDTKKLAAMIECQSLVTMVYPVIMRQTDDCWTSIKEYLRPVYDHEVHKGLVQEYEIQSLLDDMEKDGIDCMPMKGWIMRNYYPDPLMRSMGDLDVLIKDMDSQNMQKWMEARGYILENSTYQVHDEYRKPPYTLIELHKKFIDVLHLWKLNIAWIDDLVNRLWDKKSIVQEKNHIYQLSNEDFYIYHLLHFYKHFISEGSGIRPLVDIYIFLTENNLDRMYLQQQLKILNLSTFAERMEQLAFVCFSGQALQDEVKAEEARQVVSYLTGSGTYGDQATSKLAAVISQGTGSFAGDVLASRVKKCFPSRQILQRRYPRLCDYPWMLPFYWMLRATRIVFLERYKVYKLGKKTNELIKTKSTDTEMYNEIERVFRIVGITTKSE